MVSLFIFLSKKVFRRHACHRLTMSASTCCSAATRPVPAAADPATATASRTRRPTASTRPARWPWRARATPAPTAASLPRLTRRHAAHGGRRLHDLRQGDRRPRRPQGRRRGHRDGSGDEAAKEPVTITSFSVEQRWRRAGTRGPAGADARGHARAVRQRRGAGAFADVTNRPLLRPLLRTRPEDPADDATSDEPASCCDHILGRSARGAGACDVRMSRPLCCDHSSDAAPEDPAETRRPSEPAAAATTPSDATPVPKPGPRPGTAPDAASAAPGCGHRPPRRARRPRTSTPAWPGSRDDGTVFVRTPDGEREVRSYPRHARGGAGLLRPQVPGGPGADRPVRAAPRGRRRAGGRDRLRPGQAADGGDPRPRGRRPRRAHRAGQGTRPERLSAAARPRRSRPRPARRCGRAAPRWSRRRRRSPPCRRSAPSGGPRASG